MGTRTPDPGAESVPRLSTAAIACRGDRGVPLRCESTPTVRHCAWLPVPSHHEAKPPFPHDGWASRGRGTPAAGGSERLTGRCPAALSASYSGGLCIASSWHPRGNEAVATSCRSAAAPPEGHPAMSRRRRGAEVSTRDGAVESLCVARHTATTRRTGGRRFFGACFARVRSTWMRPSTRGVGGRLRSPLWSK